MAKLSDKSVTRKNGSAAVRRVLMGGSAAVAMGVAFAPTSASASTCNGSTGGTSAPTGYACGNNAQVPILAIGGVAFGSDVTASGIGAAAFGKSSTASGLLSSAFGIGNTASGIGAAAFGNGNKATGDGSAAFGVLNTSKSRSGDFMIDYRAF